MTSRATQDISILSKKANHINQHYIAVSFTIAILQNKHYKSEWSRSLPLNVILIPSLYISAVSFSCAYRPFQVASTRFLINGGEGATWDNQVCVWVDEGIPGFTSNQRVHGSNLRECHTLLLLFFFEGQDADQPLTVETSGEGGGVGLCVKLVVALHYNHFLMSYLISSCCVWQKSYAFVCRWLIDDWLNLFS